MGIRLIRRDPNKAYVSDMLWLPKKFVPQQAIRDGLQYWDVEGKQPVLKKLWEDSRDHIICPREYIKPSQYSQFPFPFVDLTPKIFPKASFTIRYNPRDEEQKRAYEALSKSSGGILNLACGKGKALWDYEPVLTTTGWKSIAQLVIGDDVFGSDGNPTKVLGVFPQGQRPLFKVKFTDGTYVICDDDHLWTVELRRTRSPRTVTISTKQLREQSLRNKSGHKFYIPLPEPLNYLPVSLPINSYLLGILLGDGCLRASTPSFTSMDIEIVKEVEKSLPAGLFLTQTKSLNSGRAKTYLISGGRKKSRGNRQNSIKLSLIGLGLWGTTSHTKFVPEPYMKADIENRLAIIQGLMDTDGYATVSGSVEYSTVSEKLKDCVCHLVRSLGGTATVQKRHNHWRVLVKLPQGISPFRLSRKRLVLEERANKRQREPYKAITDIEFIGFGPATCIKVAASDGLFITRDFTLTHNTFLALKRAAELGRPLLVIVHNSYLLTQWLEEAIPEHVIMPPGETVGVIHREKFEWKKQIVVAMIHSLAIRADKGDIPPEFREHFGTVVYDEVHHLSAPVFVTTASLVTGIRYGLTATEKRADGFDFIYKYHIGEVFYSDLVQKLIPRIYFQLTPVYVDLKRKEVRDKNGELNIGRLRSFIGGLDSSNYFRAKCLEEALNQGRKILAVSHSKDQLIKLHEMFPGSGLVVEETPVEERSQIVRKSKLCFAIARLGFEGLDDPAIDAVHVLLPFKQPNDLQQVMGRAQRVTDSKKTPVIVIYDDVRVEPLHGMCRTMQKNLKDWDKHVPGMPALTFTVLNAPNF